MSTGNVLYLLMTVGSFVAFALVLAYVSWGQSKLGPEVLTEQAEQNEARHALAG
jgi:hypothetical protein